MRIDEKTVVPLTWMISLLIATSGGMVTAAWWVKSVNDRLLAIERKLEITYISHQDFSILPAALAKEKSK